MNPTPMFELDPRLAGDTLPRGDLPLCRVLLMNDARYPWLILVPRRSGCTELDQLERPQRGQLMDEIAMASAVLRAEPDAHKLNVGALGNVVRQLHVHVLARHPGDPAWPGPVWGRGRAEPYPPHDAGVRLDRFKARWRDAAGTDFRPAASGQPPVGK
jgi:diadenosine tetraphosphate (Ap4A) HIT family hydrolase